MSRTPQRVLMTTDAVGGVWNYSLALSAGLGRHGMSVVLASMGPRPDESQRADAAALPNVTLCESDFRLEWMASPWGDVDRAGEWLLDLEARFAPDVVHLNGYVHAALPWRAPTLCVGHSCVLSWWRGVRGVDAPVEWARYREAVAGGLRAATRVVAPSRAMLDALVTHYGALARAGVIYNGCDPARFAAREKEPFVLCVGRLWDEAKNALSLAAIAPQLDWPVRVAGDCTDPDGAVRAVPNVAATGRCSPRTLADLYGRAAIYALPARYEPFGLSALEAALSGCALVLGDIPSLREIWCDAALFVPPDDRDALCAALQRLIRDPRKRMQFAARARERAAEFSLERMVNGYLTTYARVLEPGRRSAPALTTQAGRESAQPLPVGTTVAQRSFA